jgi:hypothetical protein
VLSLLVNRGSRALIEELEPGRYLSSSYYARWLAAAEQGALNRWIGVDELERWRSAFVDEPDLGPPVTRSPERVARLRESLAQATELAPADNPRFAVGDRVRVRRDRIEHHHRCPRYVRGVAGRVQTICGVDWLPGLPRSDEILETVYTVRFSSLDLWGESSSEPEFTLHVDLWQSYLESP